MTTELLSQVEACVAVARKRAPGFEPTLGVILAAKIVLGLLLGLGPLFVALLLFDATRGLFEGWLRAAIAFALAPLMAILGLVVQLNLIAPDLSRLAEMRAQGLSEAAPASSIFLLTLIATGVSLALTVAVGVIAASLRLPRGGAVIAVSPVRSVQAITVHPASQSMAAPGLEPRALAIASAAAAQTRRDVIMASGETAAPAGGRIAQSLMTPAGSARVAAPVSRTYRRPIAPRRTASNLRRDR